MKKTLIALAAVASTAAFAQNVTLSGTIDTGFEKRASGDAVKMTGDRNGTSNWTLRGSEDLGGGLKANFQISTSFNPDTGTAGNATTGTNNGLGNNGMFVELQGNFGQVRAGRPVHILWGNVLSANGTKGVTGYAASTALASTTTGGAANGVYVDNAIQYFSPRMGGLQVQVEYAAKETTTAGSNGVGVALNYTQGPLAVTYTNYKGAKGTGDKQKAVNQIAAAYDFGVARVLLTYRDQGGLASNADNSYALGVTVPVGNGQFYASYGVTELAASDAKRTIAGYKYSLSKRTTAYFNVASANKAANTGATGTASGIANYNKSSTGYGFGLQHNF